MGEKLHVVRDKGDPPCRGVWEDDGPLRGVFVGPHAEHDAHLFAGAKALKAASERMAAEMRKWSKAFDEIDPLWLRLDELELAAKSCEPPEVPHEDTQGE